MNTVKLDIFVLRLTIFLYALITGINVYADGSTVYDLTAIDSYRYITSTTLNTTGTSGGYPNNETQFYVLGINTLDSEDKSKSYTLSNNQKVSAERFIIKDSGDGVAFKIESGLRVMIKVCFESNNSDNSRHFSLKQNFLQTVDGTTSIKSTNVIISPQTKTNTVWEYSLNGSNEDNYFSIEGYGNEPISIRYIEILPYIDSSITYSGTSPVIVTINGDNPLGQITVDSSNFTASGTLADNTSVASQKNIEFYYGDHNQWWAGDKPLTWTQIYLDQYFFDDDNITINSGDKLYYYATPTSDSVTPSSAQFNYIDSDNNWAWSSVSDGTTNYTCSYDSENKRYEFPLDTYKSIVENYGLIINTDGCTVSSIKYEPASTDSIVRYEVNKNGAITLRKTPFKANMSCVTATVPEHLIVTTNSNGESVAVYFPYTEKSIPVRVTSTLNGILTLEFKGLDPDYDDYIVWRGDYSVKLPTPNASFATDSGTNDVTDDTDMTYENTSSRSSDYNIEFECNLEYDTYSKQEYYVTIESDGTVSLYWNEGNSYNKTSDTKIDTTQEIFPNALFYVTVTGSYTYSTDNITYTAQLVYPLVIMCPNYTFAKIGSDAKLITGCASTSSTYNNTDNEGNTIPDSTSSDWIGWSTEKTNGILSGVYDDLGAYYLSAAWPICYSWCMNDEMYKSYYRIDYHIFADYGDGTTSDWKDAYTTSIVASGDNNSVTGVELKGVKINRKGGNGLNKDYIYDALEITCATDQSRTLPYGNTIYLETKIYAASDDDHDVEGAGTLVGKGLYKFILYKPPYIKEDEDGNRDGIIASDNGAITMVSKNYSTDTNSRYLTTGYTTDASLPMDLNAENITFIKDKLDSNNEYIVASSSSDNMPAHTTVFFISDFVTPDYYFYTGEGGTNNTSNELAVLSEKYMYKEKTSIPYSVEYDTQLIPRDSQGNYTYDADGNLIYSSTIYSPDDEKLNKRIQDKLQYSDGTTSTPKLHVMLGTQNVLFLTSVKKDNISNNVFQLGGVQWKVDPDNGFDEYIDDLQQPLGGFAWAATSDDFVWDPSDNTFGGDKDITYDKDTHGSINANPYTECNGGLGNSKTEDGGMFLTPMSGDFVRLEPEYDGVVTLWVRQNGASDNSTRRTGYLARRPTYIMDEDGVIMKRSTYKPTVESYYCVDGTYAAISGRNTFRRDFEETWRYGVLNWDQSLGDNTVSTTQDAYRLYGNWFSSISLKENGSALDLDNTTFVDRYDKMSPIIYRSDYMVTNYEANISAPSFAKYGYELPNFSYVRYRIPVKAGKSYYVGGRGTKNGFLGVQFDEMPANYNAADYAKEENFELNYGLAEGKEDDQYYKNSSLEGKDRESVSDIHDSYDSSNITYKYKTYAINAESGETELPYDGTVKDGTTIDVKVNRTFTAGYWHPIVLPFSVSETRMKEMFGDEVAVLYLDPNANALKGDNRGNWTSVVYPAIYDDLVLRFTRHYYQMLYANTPAFICPGGNINKVYDDEGKVISEPFTSITNPTFKRVTFQTGKLNTSCKNTQNSTYTGVDGYQISPELTFGTDYKITGHYVIKGTYSGTTLGASSSTDTNDYGIYYLSNDGATTNTAQIYHLTPGATVTMNPTRVWIEWVTTSTSGGSSQAPPRLTSVGYQSYEGYELEDAPDTNAIYDIIADEVTIPGYADDTVYDMMGRVVAKGTTEGLAPGIYIYQGRKVVVK